MEPGAKTSQWAFRHRAKMVVHDNVQIKIILYLTFSLFRPVCLANYSFVQNNKNTVDRYMEALESRCMLFSRVKPNLVKDLKLGKFGKFKGQENNEIKDFVLCLLMDMGVITADGVFILDVIASRDVEYLKELSLDAVNACVPKHFEPPKEMAWKYFKCYQQTRTIIIRDFFRSSYITQLMEEKRPKMASTASTPKPIFDSAEVFAELWYEL